MYNNLIVGLGNPGNSYINTRHNLGFMLLDSITKANNLVFSKSKKFLSEICILKNKTILLKPLTYMNLSGSAVKACANYYKIPNSCILVCHDDIDLEIATVKVKIGGGNAGHNGIKSIDQNIGKDYWRMRIGIGRPIDSSVEISDYVLGKLTTSEAFKVDNIISEILTKLDIIISGEFQKLQCYHLQI